MVHLGEPQHTILCGIKSSLSAYAAKEDLNGILPRYTQEIASPSGDKYRAVSPNGENLR